MPKRGRKRLKVHESPYIHFRLNRARCQPRLEALERVTHRSWPNIIEILLERATPADLMTVRPANVLPEPQREQPHA